MSKLLFRCLLTALSATLVSSSLSYGQVDLPVHVKSALLLEAETGTVLYSENPDERLVPASLVKIMTLVLVMEYVKATNLELDTKVQVSRRASRIGGRQIYLKEDEYLTVEELIKSAAIFSANDASYALAELVAGSEEAFVQMMNDKAKVIGMKETHFVNSHGLPAAGQAGKQYTTAYDLGLLARYVIYNVPELFDYTSQKTSTIRDGAFSLVSTNKSLWKREDVFGLKTGFVNASGFCVVSTARQGNMTLISIIMGANNKQARFSAAERLFDYGFENFVLREIKELPEGKAVTVTAGVESSAQVTIVHPAFIVLPREKSGAPSVTFDVVQELEAPVFAGQPAGTVSFSWGEELTVNIPLMIANDIPEKKTLLRKASKIYQRVKTLWSSKYAGD
ncbi:MAG: D-alanyl-D-alanine carboxypeptidase family protein [Candidatus Auribacterota bacterium]